MVLVSLGVVVGGFFEVVVGWFEVVVGFFEVMGFFEVVGGFFEVVGGFFEVVRGFFEVVGGFFEVVGGFFEVVVGFFEVVSGNVAVIPPVTNDVVFDDGGMADGGMEGVATETLPVGAARRTILCFSKKYFSVLSLKSSTSSDISNEHK